MTHRTFLVLCAVLVGLVAGPASSVDVALTYQRHPEKQEGFLPFGHARLTLAAKPPPGGWKLPELKGRYTAYALVKFGSGERLLVLTCRNDTDAFFNRAYFDANGNGDLTDDPATDTSNVESMRSGDGGTCESEFPAIDTKVEVEGKEAPYSFLLHAGAFEYERLAKEGVTDESLQNCVYAYLRPNCSYAGKAELDGQTYFIALGDSNANGRFDDRAGPVAGLSRGPESETEVLNVLGDALYLSTKAIEYRDHALFPDQLLVGGRLYGVAFHAADSRLVLTPVEGPLARLELPAGTERLSILSKEPVRSIAMYQPGTTVEVPEGDYALLSYQLLRKDPQGDTWLLGATGAAAGPQILVGGRKAAAVYGEPFTPRVGIPPWAMQSFRSGGSRELALEFTIVGAGKEIVTDLGRISGQSTKIELSAKATDRPKEPVYKIVKRDGEMVSSGSFEYG